MIYYVFWRSYTPYFAEEGATILASPEALPAPPRARFWLAIAILSVFACVFPIVIGTIHGKPVWSLGNDFGSNFFIAILLTVWTMFQKPFNKILSSER